MLKGLQRAAKKGGKARTNDARMCVQGLTFGRTPGIGQRVTFRQPKSHAPLVKLDTIKAG